MANICVFCSSSENIDSIYLDTAAEMGRLIGESGHNLVYGGINLGCMDEVARAAKTHGAEVIGIVPLVLRNHPKIMDGAILVETLHHRKAEMEARSDAFVCLAGGWGTLDESVGVITTKCIGEHNDPIVIVNTKGSYNHLFAHTSQISRNRFVREGDRKLYHPTRTPKEAMDYLTPFIST